MNTTTPSRETTAAPSALTATLQCKVKYGGNGDQAFFFKATDDAGRTALADLRERFCSNDNGVYATSLKRGTTGIGIEELCLVIPRR